MRTTIIMEIKLDHSAPVNQEEVQKTVLYGLGALLDGVIEGTGVENGHSSIISITPNVADPTPESCPDY